jgi:hypothetical protein
MHRLGCLVLGVMLVPCAFAEGLDEGPDRLWRLVEIDGVPFSAVATIDLTDPATVSGRGPCNRFFAHRSGSWPDFNLGPVLATRMACDALDYEMRFFRAMAMARTGEVVPAEVDTALILYGPQGSPRLAFIPAEP